tara:strand:- start:408 stop:1934 length:1527 start_codon:yes stop_codon:yes gene_type:complete
MNNKNSKTLLKAKGLTKKFGDFVANNSINIEIQKGEIHALLGENGAGKSTLVKMFYGLLSSDSGDIILNGQEVNIINPKFARSLGIGMVFQHFSLFPALTVSENILISLDQKLSKHKLENKIIETSNKWGLSISPSKKVAELSVGEQQRVEIIRCLLQNPKLLIMDEPTSVLSPQEIVNLFKVLKNLSKSGCSILYISHKLHEIKEIAKRVTILKSGRVIDALETKNVSTNILAEKMVGKKVVKLKGKKNITKFKKSLAFSVNNLCRTKKNQFGVSLNNINFSLNFGEILGVAGIAGNGQVELMEALSGESPGDKEEIIFKENAIGNSKIQNRRQLGIEFVPEERNNHATVPDLRLHENTFLTFFGHYIFNKSFTKKLISNPNQSFATSKEIVSKNDVRCPYENPFAKQLSGGNLQKFIIGRSFQASPKLAIISQPTWGVDIGAATIIRQKILNLASMGKAIILISQDLDEIFELSDNICVISNGNLSKVQSKKNMTPAKVGLLMGVN